MPRCRNRISLVVHYPGVVALAQLSEAVQQTKQISQPAVHSVEPYRHHLQAATSRV